MAFKLLLAICFALVFVRSDAVCKPGRFIDGNGKCLRCPLDTFNEKEDAKKCKKCPNGRFTDIFGAKSMYDCKDCPPGMFITSDNICETCNPGTFNPFVNARKCQMCPKGTFSNTYNPSYCSPCRAGRVTNKKDTTLCDLCKGKMYQPQLGQRECIKCPKGTVTNPDGASCRPTCNPKKPGCIVCPPGTEKNRKGKCKKCPEGTINAHPSVTKCYPCPDALMTPFIIPTTLVPNTARTDCVCRKGESLDLGEPFGPTELNPVCSNCPKGRTSDGVTCSG